MMFSPNNHNISANQLIKTTLNLAMGRLSGLNSFHTFSKRYNTTPRSVYKWHPYRTWSYLWELTTEKKGEVESLRH